MNPKILNPAWRGNSGLLLQDRNALQVLDSCDNQTYAPGQAASIYKQQPPLVNAMRKPTEWVVYEVIFKENGSLFTPARVTGRPNGVVGQNNVALKGPSEYMSLPRYQAHGKAPISLQDQGNPVAYR